MTGLGSPARPLDASGHEMMIAQALPICIATWGALAFGAVYAWAYWPLFAASVLAGLLALHVTRAAGVATRDRAFVLALTGVGAAIILQLIPLPTRILAVFSPHSVDVLQNLNPAFAAGLVSWHSLSVWPKDTAVALALYSALALLLVGMTRLLSVTGSRRLVEALTALGVVLALIGIIQKPLYAGAVYGLWEPELGRMPFGPFVNKNHFAGWMLMALPLTLALLLAGIDRGMRGLRPGWRHKVLWFSSSEASQLILIAGAAVVMALSLMLTMSRSGILSFGLSLLVTGGLVIRALDSRWRQITAAASLALILIVVVGWTGPETLANRFAAGDWGEFNNRRGAWNDAWSVIKDFPVAGTGLNTYWAAALFYQRHELAHFFAQTHNDYLQVLAEGGLLLTVPAVICLGVFIRDVRRAGGEPRGSLAWWLRAGAATSLLAIACQETVEFSLQMPGNAVLFAIVCAVALHRPSEDSGSSESARVPGALRLVAGRRTASLGGTPAFPHA